MGFVCVSEGYGPRVYNNCVDAEDAAVTYAEQCDDEAAEGPTERVVFVCDVDDPDGEIVTVDIEYEWQPVYSSAESDEEPSAALLAEIAKEIAAQKGGA